MRIPFVDLNAQYLAHRQEFDAAFAAVISKSAFIGGEFVRAFESGYADMLRREALHRRGQRHRRDLHRAADARHRAGRRSDHDRRQLDLHRARPSSQAGATPVFVDVDDYYQLDLDQVEGRITPRTRAIIPVHLYGQARRWIASSSSARAAACKLIEDCAQAHLAQWRGRRVGTIGVAATFSFYPGKNLGAYGDAGAIVTNDAALARTVPHVRQPWRADEAPARDGGHQQSSRRTAGRTAQRQAQASDAMDSRTPARRAAYEAACWPASQGIELPRARAGSTHVYHLYVIACARRDELKAWLGPGASRPPCTTRRRCRCWRRIAYLGLGAGGSSARRAQSAGHPVAADVCGDE